MASKPWMSFKLFQRLCKQLAAEPSYNEKTSIVRSFIKTKCSEKGEKMKFYLQFVQLYHTFFVRKQIALDVLEFIFEM